SRSQIDGDPFFTLTQNGMADDNYLTYVRQMYGQKIYVPSKEESKACFHSYVVDAQRRLEANQLKPGEDVKIVDGRVKVAGQVAMMGINGVLTKLIFDKNPQREFYLEESFPLDWMYPHLTPRGLILKIERLPVGELSEQGVGQDREYWRK